MAARRSLDAELVRRELAPNRDRARSMIEDRQVTVNGAIGLKPATMVLPGDAIEVLDPPARFVGRGGDKMLGALQAFDIDPRGLGCVDVGSSTGGFTDCLLQHGAASVVAIDVGRGQLHERLRADPRVLVCEKTDVRSVDVASIGGPFGLVVVDVSFIGVAQIIDKLVALVDETGRLIVLVKPQFESRRVEASRGRGVIRDPEVWRSVLASTIDVFRWRGLVVVDVAVSPITGGAGNVEFLVHLGGPDATVDTPLAAERDPEVVNEVIEAARSRSLGPGR